MKRILPLAIIATIVGLFLWTLLFLYHKSQAKPIVFQTEQPFEIDIVKKTVATGSIVPRREVELKSQVSGVVETLFVEPGKAVKKEDPVAHIRINPDMVTLNQADARVRAARIALDGAKRELERYEGLAQRKLLADAELQRYRTDYELKRQEVDAAESNLQLVKEGASRKTGKASNEVRSTVDGMVLEVPVELGAQVIESNTFNAGTTIASVADMGDMIFKGKVDESEVGRIRKGMELDIQIAAIEGKTFKGTLEYIAPKGVEAEGAIQFEIRAALAPIEDKEVFIRAGYSANADIVLDRRDKTLAIHEGLLQFDGDKPYVEVEVAPQQFERRDVEVGLSDGINIEMKGGIGKDARIKRPQPVGG